MKNFIKFIIGLLFVICFLSCSSIPNSLLPTEDDSAKVLLEKARNIYDLNEYEKSLEGYKFLIEKFPEEREIIAWAYYETGFIQFELKMWEEALENFYIVVNEYSFDNHAAYTLAYNFVRRIEYAFATDNMEILLHNSSYDIPDDFDPLNNEENNENESNDNNNSNDNSDNSNNDNDNSNNNENNNGGG